MLAVRRELTSRRATALGTALVAIALLLPRAATAEHRWYGFGGGASLGLSPTSDAGGLAAASAAMSGEEGDAPGALSLSGTLVGAFSKESWALLPLLFGDAGLRLGRVELFLSGGVQIFGAARREQWTVFATFGLVGGAGASLRIGDELRLNLRALIVWLPSKTTAKIEAPDDRSKPTFLLGGAYLSLEFRRPFRGD